jgi:membrane peptidoglycan carboxypeptidase
VRGSAGRDGARRDDSYSNGSDGGGRGAGRSGYGAGAGRLGAGSRGASGREAQDVDFWDEQPARRGGRNGAATGTSRLADTFRSGRNATGSGRSARYARGEDGRPGGGTALSDRSDFWDGDARGTRGLRARVAERTGLGSGGTGGPGGGGRGGRGGWDGRPRSGGERFKQWLLYGRWWRHWTWKKALAVLAGGFVGVILLVVGAFFIMYEKTTVPTASEVAAQYQSSTVYWADGKLMGTFSGTSNGMVIDRILLTQAQIPKDMTEAMVAAEDRHFYSEGGVSLTGLLRSGYQDIFGSGDLQGGSTITMQYAKNAYAGVDTGRNISTKLKEVFIAIKLAHQETKPWIMTSYLNTVPFSGTADGLGAAAEQYFSINLTKPGATLTLSQAAMLAALPNAPGVLNPDPKAGAAYTALVNRFRYVLTNMVRDGAITQAQANGATFPKLHEPAGGDGMTGTTAYLLNMVLQQLEAPKTDGGYGLTQQEIDTRGYKITTTFSQTKMKALARTVAQEKATMREDAAAQGMSPFQRYDRLGAVLENVKNGAITAIYGGPGWPTSQSKKAIKRCDAADCYINAAEDAEQVGSSFKPYVLATAVRQGMNVFTSKLDGYAPIWIPESPYTSTTELALSRTSPPAGVPAPAVGGYSTQGTGVSTYWYKFPEAGENSGVLPVNGATATSSDPAFEDLLHRTSVNAVINTASAFGVGQTAFVNPCAAAPDNATVAQTIAACNDMTGPDYKVGKSWYKGNGMKTVFGTGNYAGTDHGNVNTSGSLQMALGQSPLTPVEQASTFATLADDGLYHTPHVIASMTRNGVPVASPLPKPKQVLTTAQAADTDYALSFDNRYPGGTADGAVSFRAGDMIGKTGTLGNGSFSSEAWFLGALPDQYSMAVALFTNLQSQNLDNLPGTAGWSGSYGGAWPATLWNAYMTKEFANTKATPLFQTTNGFPFTTWIQAHAKKKALPTCRLGQTQNCKCPHGDPFCGNPNPGPTCHGNSGNCIGTSPSPSPSPSCGGFGQPSCTTTSPSPSPSTSFAPGATETTSAVLATSEDGAPLVLVAREADS